MSVWLCIPSARPPELAEPVLRKWRERGYKIALWRNSFHPRIETTDAAITDEYPGYAVATNALVNYALKLMAEWCVIGGDDVEPDQNHSAEEIARQCNHYFGVRAEALNDGRGETFGVMQATGDRWGSTDAYAIRQWPDRPAYIDRVCGSAWLGREFCLRVNQGRGPLWPEYFHQHVDEELQCVAKKLGILWQRRDLTQLHQHWARKPHALASDMPDHLANDPRKHMDYGRPIFERRRADGFPGHEPLVTA